MKRLSILCIGIFLCQTISPGNICGKTQVELSADGKMGAEKAAVDAQEQQPPESQAESEPDDLMREYMNQAPVVRQVPDADMPAGVVEIDPPIRPGRTASPIPQLLELTIDPILPLNRDEQIDSDDKVSQRTAHPFAVSFDDDDDESPSLSFSGRVVRLSNPLASPTQSLVSSGESSPVISPSGMIRSRRQSMVYTLAGVSPSPLNLSPGTPPDPSQVSFRKKEECIRVDSDLTIPSYFVGGEKGSMHAIRNAHEINRTGKMPIPKEVPLILMTPKRASASEMIQDPQRIMKSKFEDRITEKAEHNERLAESLAKRKALQNKKFIFQQLRQYAMENRKYERVKDQLAKDADEAEKQKEKKQFMALEKAKEKSLEIVRSRVERNLKLLGPVHIISKL